MIRDEYADDDTTPLCEPRNDLRYMECDISGGGGKVPVICWVI